MYPKQTSALQLPLIMHILSRKFFQCFCPVYVIILISFITVSVRNVLVTSGVLESKKTRLKGFYFTVALSQLGSEI